MDGGGGVLHGGCSKVGGTRVAGKFGEEWNVCWPAGCSEPAALLTSGNESWPLFVTGGGVDS